MEPKTVILVSRQWHKPEIEVAIDAVGIGIKMPITDFIKALVSEVGNPTAILTKAKHEEKLLAAVTRIVTGMKEETVRVI